MEPLHSIKESAVISRMSTSWWRQKVFRKEVRYVRIGRRIWIPQSTIEDLVKKGLVEPENKS